jgi:hypothetical protein
MWKGLRVRTKTIIKQNEKIDDFLSDQNSEQHIICKFIIKSKSKIKSKNPKLKLIIEVSPELRKIILNLNKLNIEWSRHSVKDFIYITRCFKCLGFGHSKNNCDSDQQHKYK